MIGFGPHDLEGVEVPHDDALVIHATIANYNVALVFVDTNSSVNIIFKKAFNQMQIDEADLQPMATSLFGFTGHEVRPLGQINLAISLGEEPLRRTRRTFFTVVDAPSAYNVILGRPTLSAFSAVVSVYHQKIKFPIGRPAADLTGVSPSVAVHRLNMLPGVRPVKQKRRHFGPEQNKIIREEVRKLMEAEHIWEVHFPTWLSNVVLVPKPGNKWRVCVDFRDLNKVCPKRLLSPSSN
ncbi:uncharacterized protein LOC141816623 [Curcuma longa]|uniref:uncharacterized protein LOC141816623 n=1 Tax=Curcuma longa TaxID=136217 RepID=UPI003D9E351D